MNAPRPYALLAELTYRCPLHCPYCSNPLSLRHDDGELSTAEWRDVFSQAARLGVVQIHFTGGEPLVRTDLPELIRAARTVDLYTHLVTSGVGLSAERIEQLCAAGLDAVQISLQDSRSAENDWLSAAPSFEKKTAAVIECLRRKVPTTLNVVLHRLNLDRIEEFIQLAEQWGVNRLELAHTQYTGWAFRNRAVLHPTREQFEHAQAVVTAARQRLGHRLEILHVLPDYFQQFPKACLNGWGRTFLTVTPDGYVLPCQTAREIKGLEFLKVGENTLEEIWNQSPAFRRFRGCEWMSEPCRSCERRETDFGGCRCQAFLMTGDAANTDPVCSLSPHRVVVDQALAAKGADPTELTFRRI